MTRYLNKWLQQEGVETVQDIKNILGLEQFYRLLPGELRYLVRDKKPRNLQEAGETADFISHIRNPNFSEGKVVRKACEDTNRNPREQFKNQQTVGGHFVGKPSGHNQIRNKDWEGKGVKGSSYDQMNFRTSFLSQPPSSFTEWLLLHSKEILLPPTYP